MDIFPSRNELSWLQKELKRSKFCFGLCHLSSLLEKCKNLSLQLLFELGIGFGSLNNFLLTWKKLERGGFLWQPRSGG